MALRIWRCPAGEMKTRPEGKRKTQKPLSGSYLMGYRSNRAISFFCAQPHSIFLLKRQDRFCILEVCSCVAKMADGIGSIVKSETYTWKIISCVKICNMKREDKLMEDYRFWGWENSDVEAITNEYPGIHNPRQLYGALWEIWCADTCAPRMRSSWTKENRTLGQCSITAFLAQDIFGGKVYGIRREGGSYHCYNVIGDCRFDLTSEQFGEEKLDYENNSEQLREVHFEKEEKRLRYEYLKGELKKYCRQRAVF